MAEIVDMERWRRDRALRMSKAHPAWGDTVERGGWAPSASPDHRPGRASTGDVQRLDRAMGRLTPLVSGALDRQRALDPAVETELLAIMGELTLGLIREAAGRGERLAERLAAGRRSS